MKLLVGGSPHSYEFILVMDFALYIIAYYLSQKIVTKDWIPAWLGVGLDTYKGALIDFDFHGEILKHMMLLRIIWLKLFSFSRL